jgi:hypothetical protein
MRRNPANRCDSIGDIAARAAARLNLTLGRNGKWRGRYTACDYVKSPLEVALEDDCIAVSYAAWRSGRQTLRLTWLPKRRSYFSSPPREPGATVTKRVRRESRR